jgi:uncharacterized protein (TIGR01777 family)
MSKKILITGASGLIGAKLSKILSQNYSVVYLGRTKRHDDGSSFVWDVKNQEMDQDALTDVDTIVHLAGAGVGEKRWTTSWKKEILDSRVQSTALLLNALKTSSHSLKTFVSASAIGFYGFGDDQIFDEQNKAGGDFLAQVTKQWEEEIDKTSLLGIRVVKIRIGIVLSKEGGALMKMMRPVNLGLGAALGSGDQYLSWIHIDDLCKIFVKAIEEVKLTGAYNATAGWATNSEMTKLIAKILNKPLWLPNVPPFVLKIILGEMAEIVLNGNKISSEKIKQTGFQFQFDDLETALHNLIAS